MGRTVNPETHALRRDAFADSAMRLIQAKGYEQFSIQDVIDDLGVSKGAFYHYFDSKEALLAAVVDRTIRGALEAVEPVVRNPNLPALAKLGGVFAGIAQWKGERRELMLEVVRVWLSDANTVVRERLRRAVATEFTPVLVTILRQGVAEGAFSVSHPEGTAILLTAVILGLNESATNLFLARQAGTIPLEVVEYTLAAYAEGFERILGIPPGSWPVNDPSLVREWFG